MSAIVVVVNLAVLCKDILFDFFDKLFLFDEVVLSAMNFSLPGSPGGVADAEFEDVWEFLQKEVYQSSLSDSWAPTDDQWFVPDHILLVVEEGEILLSILVHILWLLQQTWAQEVVENLPQLRMGLQIVYVLLFNCLFYCPEVCLQLRVEVLLVLLHKVI